VTPVTLKVEPVAKAAMFGTRIFESVELREKMVALLNQQVADTFDLYSQVKQAHWNTKGPQFYPLHLLFDDLAGKLAEYVDTIAERVTAIGGTAMGTVRMAALASRLPELTEGTLHGLSSVEALAVRYAALTKTTRAAIETAAASGSADTADMLTQVSKDLDKALWFLEAHLQA
jgi:starvation-inducible DNA-binding protein